MASRDRSQGFAFVYVDIKKLLADPGAFQEDAHTPVTTGDAEVVRVHEITEQDERTQEMPIPAKSEAVAADPKTASANPALKQIKENLDRLQSLHHKLHAMLAELNQVTGTNKKKR